MLDENFSDEQLLRELTRRLGERSVANDVQAGLLAELQEMSDRLREAELLKSNFLSNIRNEINNPLTSILGLSGQLMTETFEPETLKRMAGLINKEAFELDFQLRNIYAAAEIEAGEVVSYPARVNVNSIVQRQIRYFRSRLTQKEVEVVFEPVSPDIFSIDVALLECICMNLLANAIEYSPYKGIIHIGARISENRLVFSVRDAGSGIEPENSKRVFERFRQLDSGSTKKHLGHGLGLSIVKEFVDAMSGQIDIDSDPGSGTCVTVMLPDLLNEQLPEGFETAGDELKFSDPEIF